MKIAVCLILVIMLGGAWAHSTSPLVSPPDAGRPRTATGVTLEWGWDHGGMEADKIQLQVSYAATDVVTIDFAVQPGDCPCTVATLVETLLNQKKPNSASRRGSVVRLPLTADPKVIKGMKDGAEMTIEPTEKTLKCGLVFRRGTL